MQTYVTKLSDTKYRLVDNSTTIEFDADIRKYNNKYYLVLPKNSTKRSYIEISVFAKDGTYELTPKEAKPKAKSELDKVKEYLTSDELVTFNALIDKAIERMKGADLLAKIAKLQEEYAKLQGGVQ